MNIIFKHKERQYKADLSKPLDISIPLKAGMENPNCYHSAPAAFDTIRSGDFTGSVAEGGSVNHKILHITPHGNGTHTECYGHLSSAKEATLNKSLTTFHFLAQVLTLMPRQTDDGDDIVAFEDFEIPFTPGAEAVVIRTLPNEKDKLHRRYSGTNPPYLDVRIADLLRQNNVKHLLVDLPSVDKEVDGGALGVHRSFWNNDNMNRKDCTITELIYIDNGIADGLYLLNLQITSLETDASPSKPVLFNIIEY